MKGGSHWMQRPDLMILVMTKYEMNDPDSIIWRDMSPLSFEVYCAHFGHDPVEILNDWSFQTELCGSNNIILFKHCLNKYVVDGRVNLFADSLNYLCMYDSLEVLKLLFQLGYSPDDSGLNEAIKNGQKDIVVWLIDVLKYPFGIDELELAAEHNQAEIYSWLVDQGSIASEKLPKLYDFAPEMIILLTQKYKLLPCKYDIDKAVSTGHLALVKILMEEHHLIPHQDSINTAWIHNHFVVLNYLWLEHKLKPKSSIIRTRDLTEFKWYLTTYDIIPDQELANTCNPSLEILKYLYTEYSLLPNVIKYDHLDYESAIWLEQQGCTMDFKGVSKFYAKHGDLKMYKFICGTQNIAASESIISYLEANSYFRIDRDNCAQNGTDPMDSVISYLKYVSYFHVVEFILRGKENNLSRLR